MRFRGSELTCPGYTDEGSCLHPPDLEAHAITFTPSCLLENQGKDISNPKIMGSGASTSLDSSKKLVEVVLGVSTY